MTFVFDLDHRHDLPLGEVVNLVGGKAAHLGVMLTELSLPVPPGFVISTAACDSFLAEGWPAGLEDQLREHMHGIEERVGRHFGDPADPLLVSVRSGAPVSMPGMMDTILNLGLNEQTAAGLASSTADEAFAKDCLTRFTAMFTDVVGSETVPPDPWEQLRVAVEAVFRSWNSDRAKAYRAVEGIADDLGTAVTVQAMVFGNRGTASGTGVLFTRNPSTGENAPFGDVLFGAQGEDVVAGTHHAQPITALRDRAPEAADQLWRHADALERRYADMCDIEFTIEQGRLWMLQVRTGKRSAQAALRIAVDMAEDPQFPLSRADAVRRVRAHLADPPTTSAKRPDALEPLTRGLPASPGVATGEIFFSPSLAADLAAAGRPLILVRAETSPQDVPAMAKSAGVLTSAGGMASHAAVVARGWGIPAVVGAEEVRIHGETCTIGSAEFAAGDTISIDGSTGEVFAGELSGERLVVPEAQTLLGWAEDLGIEIRSDQPQPAEAAAGPAGATTDVGVDDVLACLFIKAIAAPDVLAAGLLSTEDVLGPLLDELAADGSIRRVAGAVQLTEKGSSRAGELLAARREQWGPDNAARALDDLIPLDQRMKDIVTAWQLRTDGGEQSLNDHSDDEYDAAVIERLASLHDDAVNWLRSLGPAVPRFGGYVARFQRAMSAVRGGEHQFIASPRIDSYHSVWFELHEELIRLADRTREDEVSAGRA